MAIRDNVRSILDDALADFLADCFARKIPEESTLCVLDDGSFYLGYAEPSEAEFITYAYPVAGDTDMENEWRDPEVRAEYGDARKFFRECIDNDGCQAFSEFFSDAKDAFEDIPDGYFTDE